MRGIDAALYLISLDSNLEYFNKKVVSLNGRHPYEGNVRLNKILHLAQNVYIGRCGKKLINDDFYAYDNGGVLLEVQENYSSLLKARNVTFCIEEEEKTFLKTIFMMLKDAPIEELIKIDHEDPAWQEKHCYYDKPTQIMDSMKFIDDYKDRYESVNFYIDKMGIA